MGLGSFDVVIVLNVASLDPRGVCGILQGSHV